MVGVDDQDGMFCFCLEEQTLNEREQCHCEPYAAITCM
jgi:ferredoxin-thioredoxin reductase catalytic subunit